MTVFLLIVLVVVLLALRQNVVLILAVVAAAVHTFFVSRSAIEFLIQDIWFSVDRETLLAIPMFILAGAVMTRGSIARRIIDLVIALTRPVRGGLGLAGILSCGAFAAISGSSVVTMLAVGAIMYPALLSEGYDKKVALGSMTAGGTLGIIIPPSIPLLLYGMSTDTSVVDLFVAGVGPGLLLIVVMAAYVLWKSRHLSPRQLDLAEVRGALRRGGWAIMMPVILLGGIYSGRFTPTEAAAVSLLYALIVELFIHREMNVRDYGTVALATVIMSGIITPIFAFASSLNNVIAIEGYPQALTAFVKQYIHSGWGMMLTINIILLFVGCIMESFSAIVIFAPLFLPLVTGYGFDPVHFGIVMIVNLEIGYLTPPVGLNIIVGSVAFKEPFRLMVSAVIPYIALMMGALAVISAVPQISLWLVRVLH
ncbi:TRAP transporter large permease [Undibacter mobilis]|uniref:TRAP transporter large permease protein n=1 Tax=Undibacter mobilis TaxID=2292256 RepID=A0A371BAS5_9BRAD|nr:TRAP transporter large permease [Undibacter mobilis]RDV04709.1 TRAP transporter large permease [Undibacter mobilis]